MREELIALSRPHMLVVFLTVFSLPVLLVSCEETTEPEEVIDAELLRVTPSHGSVDINPDAEIMIEFGERMDTLSCQNRFGIYHGELNQIPVNMMGQMRGMISGEFHWNHDQTMLTFHPDTSLMDSSMYSICLQEGMQVHHHGQQDHAMDQGHMQGHGFSAGEGIIIHFQTGGHLN